MSTIDPKSEVTTVTPIILNDLVAMVRLGERFTQDDVARLLRQRRKTKSIQEMYINQHIGWGLKLGLFEKSNDHYRRLQDGFDLANKPDNTPELKSFLHELLLRDGVYHKFFALLQQYPKFEKFDIIERAGGWAGRPPGQEDNQTTPRALRVWAEELGIIAKLNPSKRFILVDRTRRMDVPEFWDKLNQVYKSVRGKERHYTAGVKIPEIRDELCYRWSIHPNYFDLCLRDLIASKEYSALIRLSGGPARYLREMQRKGYISLTVGKRQYLYIEIMLGQ